MSVFLPVCLCLSLSVSVCLCLSLFVLFCFVLFCFVLFCFVLFCFVLFCFVLFCFVLFCFVLFCFVLFCFVLFCFVLFCFVLFCFVLFCFVLFCFVLFCFVLFCFVRSFVRSFVCCVCFFVVFQARALMCDVYGHNDMAMQRQSLRLINVCQVTWESNSPRPRHPRALTAVSARGLLPDVSAQSADVLHYAKNAPVEFQRFLSPFSLHRICFCATKDVDGGEKLQLRHSRFSAPSGPFPAPLFAQRRASSTLPKNCTEESPRSSAQFAPYLSLWNNCSVQHSVDELNLRNQDQDVDDVELQELVQHGHRDVNR